MKKYYKEDLNIIKNQTINRTIENKIPKVNFPINENIKVNNSSNTTPRANFKSKTRKIRKSKKPFSS